MKVFVVDPHSIYRRGLASSLEMLDGVRAVGHAGSIREAWEHPDVFGADIVILDSAMDGGQDFIGAVAESTGARVIVCTSDCTEDAVLAAIQAGAVGFLRKDTLTPESLADAVRAAGSGTASSRPICSARCCARSPPTRSTNPPPRASTTASSRSSR